MSTSSDPPRRTRSLELDAAPATPTTPTGRPSRSTVQGLTGVGFVSGGTVDGQATDPGEDVLVRYGTDRQDSANTVAAALGGAKTQLDPSLGRNIVVEVASAGVTVTDVRSRVTGTPATATPTPTITARVATDDICA